jgi:hypothetical protein
MYDYTKVVNDLQLVVTKESKKILKKPSQVGETCDEALKAVSELVTEKSRLSAAVQRLEKERNAAVEDLRCFNHCSSCCKVDQCSPKKVNTNLANPECSDWIWRGAK